MRPAAWTSGEAGPPSGWRPLTIPAAGFLAANGPFYWRREAGTLHMGFRVGPRHCNPVGNCHGGMLATTADILIGFGIAMAAGINAFLPTISLTCDFLAPARRGQWIEGACEVVRLTGRMGFGQCLLQDSEGTAILRANGIFKLDRSAAPDFAMSDVFPPEP